MVEQHIASGLDLTIAGIRQPKSLARSFGVIDRDPHDPYKVRQFLEKPHEVEGLSDSPDEILASMGNYVFSTEALVNALNDDALNENSAHDMGANIVPMFVESGNCGVYDFTFNDILGATDRDKTYWRDVGTIDAFHEANMDLISVNPIFNLYNRKWPLLTGYTGLPPAKFVYGHHERLGHALDSIVSPGVIISGGEVIGSVLSPFVRVNSWSSVRDSVLFDGVNVGRNATVVRAIVDKNVKIDDGAQIGIDHARDRERGFFVSDTGIVVVPKNTHVTA
ncbi:glucose-1-phosphate adenylyltransferase [Chlamydia trachomatis]|nr:glucose-1-phosphate adenylyltransferase [Chlamydia trachomatis]